MGQLIDEEYVTKFLELLRCVPYLEDENVKIQRFISIFPMVFKDKIEMLEPQTLKDAIKNINHFYEQVKHRPQIKGNWQEKSSTRNKKNWPKKSTKRGKVSTHTMYIDLNKNLTLLLRKMCNKQKQSNPSLKAESYSVLDMWWKPQKKGLSTLVKCQTKYLQCSRGCMVGEVPRSIPRIYASMENR